MSSGTSPTRGILLMILAILLFTAMDATAKGLIQRYPAPQVIWTRFAGQLLIVLVLLGPRLGTALRTRFPVLHFWRSAFSSGRPRSSSCRCPISGWPRRPPSPISTPS